MGKGRTTTGMILACLVKDVLFGEKCRAYTPLPPVNPKDFEDEEEAFNEVIKNDFAYMVLVSNIA